MSTLVHYSLTNFHLRPAHVAGRGVVSRTTALVGLWRKRVRERHELVRLDARELRDIGITPADVAGEIAKPFWRD
jgi:uncharacterized protein YjiS (DUF1127 family)